MSSEKGHPEKAGEEALKQEISAYEQKRGTEQEMAMSEWIRRNRSLLVVAGALTTAGARAVAWIITHIDEIRQFVDVVSEGFKARSGLRVLDFDCLTLDGENLTDALCGDPILIRAVIEEAMRSHGFDAVWSEMQQSDMY